MHAAHGRSLRFSAISLLCPTGIFPAFQRSSKENATKHERRVDQHGYIVGRILLRQEGRFYVVDESGETHLFVAAHGLRTDYDALDRWQQEQTRIALRYRNAPGLLALSAIEAGPANGRGSPPNLIQEVLGDSETEQT